MSRFSGISCQPTELLQTLAKLLLLRTGLSLSPDEKYSSSWDSQTITGDLWEILRPLRNHFSNSQKKIAILSGLISPPVLSYPDYSRRFILDTDASDVGIGAVLSQVREDRSEGVVAYASRSLSRPERRYCVTRKELLAVVEFVHHFRQYLLGREFTLRTDHGSLVWVRNFKEPEGQLARWLEKLEEHNFTIIHRRGSLHSNADALSRVPYRQCGRENHDSDDVTGEEIMVGTFTQALPVSHTPEDMRYHQLDDD